MYITLKKNEKLQKKIADAAVKEKATLENYILSEEEQVITIDVNNKVYDLSFVNEKSPQTGDTNILLIVTIATCALICAIIIYIKKINLVKNAI